MCLLGNNFKILFIIITSRILYSDHGFGFGLMNEWEASWGTGRGEILMGKSRFKFKVSDIFGKELFSGSHWISWLNLMEKYHTKVSWGCSTKSDTLENSVLKPSNLNDVHTKIEDSPWTFFGMERDVKYLKRELEAAF